MLKVVVGLQTHESASMRMLKKISGAVCVILGVNFV